jgi:hypothetical protein
MSYFLLEDPAHIHYTRDAEGKYVTHVANGELILPMPTGPQTPEDRARFIEQSVDDILNGRFETAPIGPVDGRTFEDPDVLSFLSRVRSLAEMGYRVPDQLLSSVEEWHEEFHG